MVSRYFKLNIDEAYQIRKDIKSTENTFFDLSQKINAYKLLRKKEAILKNKLKVSFSSLKSKILLMESTLPEEERKNIEYNIMQKEKQIKKLNQPIQKSHTIHQVNTTNEGQINQTNIVHKHQTIKKESVRDVSVDLEEIRKKLERFK